MKKLVSMFLALTMMVSLTVTAQAANLVPSVEQKAAPEIVVKQADDGTWYVAETIVTGENGEPVVKLIEVGELVITALDGTVTVIGNPTLEVGDLSQKEQVVLKNADEKLHQSYDELRNGESVPTVIMSEYLNADETYVVSQLFDMTLLGDAMEQIETTFARGGVLGVTFKLNIASGTPFYMATKCEDEWVVLRDDQIIENEDGTYTIYFEELCPVAIIQNVEDTADVVQSPQTSDMTSVSDMMIMACVVCAAACFVLSVKKRSI